MSALANVLRFVLGRFGRPLPAAGGQIIDDNLESLDDRLTDVESKQRDIAARLRLLELQGDIRGRLHGD